MVPDCTLVQTNRGPTPLNHPAIPSVLYMIFMPVMTEEVSSIAAPCALRVVEGEEVEIGRLWVGMDLFDADAVECFDDEAGDDVAFGGFCDEDNVSLCWVCIRVLTTSKGVVITPANPPARAAVAISSGSPMTLDPMYALAHPRSSS